ncbi:MAG: nucleotide sugar dehydrogenase [Candidatus Ancaeobacter aquaticus]|nr:nucleotide sugar dehydrogenase [Candidatus Ancaeobacter aquaticus]
MSLKEKIINKKAHIAVIGLGYVGLPLAIECAKNDFIVHGIDLSKSKVDKLNKGKTYIKDITDHDVKEMIQIGRFCPTTDFSVLLKSDVVIICVPTPLRKTQDPDISHIVAAAENIAKYTKQPKLVILESTTYPGTSDEVIMPIMERNNRVLDKDYFIAFSPERIDPGNKEYTTRTIPKVIGGVSKKSTELASMLYSQIMEIVVPVSSARVAEMVKLLENTFRSVNIGLVNEIALMCNRMDINVWEVIDAAATKPFGYIPFYPGPGLGGHCLPIDPLYLSWKARLHGFETRFIHLAARVNGAMPRYVVNRTAKILNTHKKCLNGSHILILGVAYKKDVTDVRESPAIDVIGVLKQMGAKITYHDPYVPQLKIDETAMKSVKLSKKVLQKTDCVIIITNHSTFDYKFIVDNSKLIYDTRDVLKKYKNRKNITKL